MRPLCSTWRCLRESERIRKRKEKHSLLYLFCLSCHLSKETGFRNLFFMHTHTHTPDCTVVSNSIYFYHKMLIKISFLSCNPWSPWSCMQMQLCTASTERKSEREERASFLTFGLALSPLSLCPYSTSFRSLPFCGASWLGELIDTEFAVSNCFSIRIYILFLQNGKNKIKDKSGWRV